MDSSDDDAVAAAEMLGLFLKSKLDARKKRKRRAIVICSIRNIVQTCVLLIKSYQLNNFIICPLHVSKYSDVAY